MTKPLVIVGASGKMSKVLQEILSSQGIAFRIASSQDTTQSFQDSRGVIDFSLPEVSKKLISYAVKGHVPYVCGTTGWKSAQEIRETFEGPSKSIPILYDSNFSRGIELMAQAAEIMARSRISPLRLVDLHHAAKRDAPSGTALKLKARMEALNPAAEIKIESIREGEIPGEHRLEVSLEGETLEIIHRASSRKPFAEGAIKALEWLESKKSGLYSMKDVLS